MWRVAACAAVIAALVCSERAAAATTVGQTFPPTNICNAASGAFTELQTVSVSDQYEVPTGGVLTSWSTQTASPAVESLRLKVGRLVSGNVYRVVGESPREAPVANTLNVFPTRVPVQEGDVLGWTFTGNNAPCLGASAGFTFRYIEVDVADGSVADFVDSLAGLRLDLSASLELDADGDGYGDETQDACPASAEVHSLPCDRSPPETAIDKKPKAKLTTRKRSTYVEFSFSSSKAGSSFACSLDGAPFAGCSTPLIKKVGKGKHEFAVRATEDASGVTDPTPATYAWKVKVKKKK